MQTFEFEGKTTDEAIENACRQLKLTKDEIDIEIIEPGSAGIFGLVGGRKAKVKVTTTGEEPEVAEEANGVAIAKDALENILTRIPMEGVTVSAAQNDGTIALNIEGDTSGLLIGRKGRTLDALQFIVNKKGEVKDVKVLRGVNKWLDAEAVRVVKAMPNWKPGLQHGKPVSVIYNLPINFKLH